MLNAFPQFHPLRLSKICVLTGDGYERSRDQIYSDYWRNIYGLETQIRSPPRVSFDSVSNTICNSDHRPISSASVPGLPYGSAYPFARNHDTEEQLQALIQENTLFKQAVSIQHERQKEKEDRSQELHNLSS